MVFANLFVKTRLPYGFSTPLSIQQCEIEPIFLYTVCVCSKMAQSVVLENMFHILGFVTSRRRAEYLNHIVEGWAH